MSFSGFDLTEKIAIVTGGSRGIGKAIAIGLAKAGADVVVASRTLSNLEKVAEEIGKLGRSSLAIPTDISKPEEIDRMVSNTLEEFGKIDILVNNAGISPILKRAEEVTKEEWDQIINVNLTGAFLCAQAVGKVMIKQKRGKIINIASVGGKVGLPRLVAYCVTKGGIIQLTRVLAIDWARYNINVNAIGPSYIETDMTEALKSSEVIYGDIIRKTPLGRIGKPEEVVGAAVFLASEESNYMTGETIFVDGGWLAL